MVSLCDCNDLFAEKRIRTIPYETVSSYNQAEEEWTLSSITSPTIKAKQAINPRDTLSALATGGGDELFHWLVKSPIKQLFLHFIG